MRIFLSCQQSLKRHAVPAYAFWEHYFKNALKESGHEVVEAQGVDWAEGLLPLSREERTAWLGRTWDRTVAAVTAAHRERPVDLFLSYLFPLQVETSAVGALRTLGVPCVNFFCDNVREFRKVPEVFRPFDLHWVPEAEARHLYDEARMNHLYAPMPMWVRPDLRTLPSEGDGSTVFVGSHDDLREDLLGEAIGRGLSIRIHGAGWLPGDSAKVPTAKRSLPQRLAGQLGFLRSEGLRGWVARTTYSWRKRRPNAWIPRYAHPSLTDDAYFRVLRECEVVVGINRCPSFRRPFSRPLRYSRLRDIEAPMLGACYLSEMAPGLEDLYDPGVEIETYRDATELAEKALRLRADPDRRRRLRQLGQRRALTDHTIDRTMERIRSRLGLKR